ncbi:MAG: hypothetical protein V2A73_11885 [Pseudomonadota bacterium]
MPSALQGHAYYLYSCSHFRGLCHASCRAGVLHASVAEGEGRQRRYPCLLDDHARTICTRRYVLTEAEARERWAAHVGEARPARTTAPVQPVCVCPGSVFARIPVAPSTPGRLESLIDLFAGG